MTHYPLLTGVLLGIAVGIAILFTLGMALMRDALQRLHFAAVIVGLSSPLIALAVWLEDPDPEARIKVLLLAIFLPIMNAVLTHATARAIRLRQVGHWQREDDEAIPIVRDKKP